jgi:hypothetical protein
MAQNAGATAPCPATEFAAIFAAPLLIAHYQRRRWTDGGVWDPIVAPRASSESERIEYRIRLYGGIHCPVNGRIPRSGLAWCGARIARLLASGRGLSSPLEWQVL